MMDVTKNPTKIDINRATQISADLRAAFSAYRALDRCGTPVLTIEREAASARIEVLQAEEHRAWNPNEADNAQRPERGVD